MSGVNIDWKGRALAAEAETLNLKNLCAHHGICTVCGGYYSHHYTEPFATCKCNTSEWYEITEYMKLQDELRKLRQQKLLETVTENWQPIITLGNVDLFTEQVDVWSEKHGRIADVTYGKETYGKRVGIVYQADYDCNGPVLEVITDATHWMIVRGPTE